MPAEIIFDQGIGDLFVIRVAGNVVPPPLIGSVEFAAPTSDTRLVVVGYTSDSLTQKSPSPPRGVLVEMGMWAPRLRQKHPNCSQVQREYA